jgi:hypothetical protein
MRCLNTLLIIGLTIMIVACSGGAKGNHPLIILIPPENIAGDWTMDSTFVGSTCGSGLDAPRYIMHIQQADTEVDVTRYNVCGTLQYPLTGTVDGSKVTLRFEADLPFTPTCTVHRIEAYDLVVTPGGVSMNGTGYYRNIHQPSGCSTDCTWNVTVGATPCSVLGCPYDPTKC